MFRDLTTVDLWAMIFFVFVKYNVNWWRHEAIDKQSNISEKIEIFKRKDIVNKEQEKLFYGWVVELSDE